MNYGNMTKIEAALSYVERGWFVLPLCWPTADGKCACHKGHVKEKEIGKAPLLGDYYQYLRPTEDDVRRWWTKWPQANIGILLGPSRLLVVDTDSNDAWREAKAKGLPPGPSVHTGKGRHFYYRSREGLYGRTTKRGDSRAIDVLASGYIVAPPSIHRSGATYQWLPPPENVAPQDAPAWAVKLLMERASVSAQIVELPDDLPPVSVEDLSVSPGIKDLIHDGLSHHPSRSEAVFAVEMAMIEAGCDNTTLASVLLDPANGISELPREKGEEWLAGDIGRAREKAPSAPQGHGLDPQLPEDNDNCFDLLDDEEIESLPSPAWLIDGILLTEALAILYGPPEVKKSFLCLDWSLSIRSGEPWCGRAVKAGTVVYVYAEGKGNLKLRTRAWKQTHGCDGKVGVKFITQTVQCLQRPQVMRLQRTLRKLSEPPTLVVFDTLARCIQGGDENSAKDIGVLISVADQIREECHASVLIVHHPGKNGDERGSTALRGAADTMIEMSEKDDIIILSCEKQKDAAHFKPILLECHEVDLGGGETSCVLQLADEGKKASDLRSGFLNDKQRQALQALLDLGSAGARSTAWQKATEIPKTTFKRIRGELDRNKYVDNNEGRYTVTTKGELTLKPIPDLASEGESQSHPLPSALGSSTPPEAIEDECDERGEDMVC